MFIRSLFAGLVLIATPHLAAAQTKDAAAPAPTPAAIAPVKMGTTIFTDFTYTGSPSSRDADGNSVRASAFDVSRAYINVTGGLTPRITFRVTADIKRLASSSSASATSLDGSQTFRLKYAYGQIGLDGLLPKGSWVRIGAQQTPFIDHAAGLYRYRFQGTQMVEREGFLSSSDFGITGRLNLPSEYGDVHLGLYNGESYAKAEANDQKSFQIRATVRPLPRHTFLKGLYLTAFHNADRYLKGAPRNRLVLNGVFEHRYLVLGTDLIQATDQTSARAARIESTALSVWARPRTSMGIEGLLRHDRGRPNKSVEGRRLRTIVGLAYWFKTQAPVSVALLADYERVTHTGALTRPRESRVALHALFSF